MKKLICILTAVMLVFAVSCSNDTPGVSDDGGVDLIQMPEASEVLEGDALTSIETILEGITWETQFSDSNVIEDVQYLYSGSKLVAAIHIEGDSMVYEFVASAGDFKAGDRLVGTYSYTGEMTFTYNGKSISEDTANKMMYSVGAVTTRSSVSGTSKIENYTIDGESYTLDIVYNCTGADDSDVKKISISLSSEYNGISNFAIYEEYYYGDGPSRHSYCIELAGVVYSYDDSNSYVVGNAVSIISDEIDIPW